MADEEEPPPLNAWRMLLAESLPKEWNKDDLELAKSAIASNPAEPREEADDREGFELRLEVPPNRARPAAAAR
jgi:hypothetical protein